jgi:hypothetical protein
MSFDTDRRSFLHIANEAVPIAEREGSHEPARMQEDRRLKANHSDIHFGSPNKVQTTAIAMQAISHAR